MREIDVQLVCVKFSSDYFSQWRREKGHELSKEDKGKDGDLRRGVMC